MKIAFSKEEVEEIVVKHVLASMAIEGKKLTCEIDSYQKDETAVVILTEAEGSDAS